MQVVVWKISDEWKPIKYGLERGKNLVVYFKVLEDTKYQNKVLKKNSTLKLNLNSEQNNLRDWHSAIREGNILDVELFATGSTINISKYKSPKVLKKQENGKTIELINMRSFL